MILKKIGVLSLAKIYSSLMAFMGFIIGLFFGLMNLFLPFSGPGLMPYSSLGLLAIIFFPIFYGALGFVAGAFTAGIFNFITKYVGGLELEFEKK